VKVFPGSSLLPSHCAAQLSADGQHQAQGCPAPSSPPGLSTYWASITTPLATEISWGARGDNAVRPPTLSQAVAFRLPTLRLSHGHRRDKATDQGGSGPCSVSWGKCPAAHPVLQDGCCNTSSFHPWRAVIKQSQTGEFGQRGGLLCTSNSTPCCLEVGISP